MEHQAEKSLIELLKKTDFPVSIRFVAKHLGVSWVTARGLLFSAALKGKVKAVKTSKSWIFVLMQDEEDKPNPKYPVMLLFSLFHLS